MAAAVMRVRGPNRSPIILSAIIPGLGQFAQGRLLAGISYLSVFLICFIYLGICVAEIIRSAFAIVDSIKNSGNEVPEISYIKLVIPVVLAIVIYIVNLVDAFLSYRRSVTRWNEWKLMRVHGEQGNK